MMSQVTAQVLVMAFLMFGNHILVIKGKLNKKELESINLCVLSMCH